MAVENNQSFVFYTDKINYKTVLGAKGKEHFVEGYISTGDLDLVNDIVTKSCMDSMLKQFDGRNIKLDFEHETFRGKSKLDTEANKTRIPLGKAIGKEQDKKGVKIKWKMNSNWKKFDEKGNLVMDFKDIWGSIEDGMYDAFSIAYVPTKITNISREGKSIRLLDNINLLNVALTGNPINPMATMSAVMAKSLEFMKDNEGEINMESIEIKDFAAIDKAVQELKDKYNILNLSDNKVDKEKMGNKPMESLKDDAPEAEAQTPNTPVEEGKEPEAEVVVEAEPKKPEGKSMTLMELKSVVDTLTKDVDELKKENKDLKAIVEKPIQKSLGAQNKSESSPKVPEAKSLGPIDLI